MKNTKAIAQWIVDNCIVIDTETTGLGENDVVIELAAIRIKTGEVLVNELIKPNWITNQFAEATHGITWEEQIRGEEFGVVLENLDLKNNGSEFLTAFNLVFDERLIRQTGFRYLAGLDYCAPFPKPDGIICIMELANRHFAKDYAEWDSEQSRFRRLSLARCCEIAGIEIQCQAHRAFADAKAAADLVTAIAEGRV
jgi:DNA polymerase-3 subunit epsilon